MDIRWFVPWVRAVKSMGSVDQGLGWFTPFPYFVRPLWLDAFADFFNAPTRRWKIKPFLVSETVVTIG